MTTAEILQTTRERFVDRGPELWTKGFGDGQPCMCAVEVLWTVTRELDDPHAAYDVFDVFAGMRGYPREEACFALTHLNDAAETTWDDVVAFLDHSVKAAA